MSERRAARYDDPRVLELTGEVLHIAERLEGVGAVRHRQIDEVTSDLQRPLIQRDRLDVGVDPARLIAGESSEAPRFLVTLRTLKVQRQHCRLIARFVARVAQHRLGDAAMQSTPCVERKAGVGDVADEGVAEPDPTRRLCFEQLGQASQGFRCPPTIVVAFGEHGPDVVDLEPDSEHRHVAQQRPVVGGEPVDTSRDQTFN